MEYVVITYPTVSKIRAGKFGSASLSNTWVTCEDFVSQPSGNVRLTQPRYSGLDFKTVATLPNTRIISGLLLPVRLGWLKSWAPALESEASHLLNRR